MIMHRIPQIDIEHPEYIVIRGFFIKRNDAPLSEESREFLSKGNYYEVEPRVGICTLIDTFLTDAGHPDSCLFDCVQFYKHVRIAVAECAGWALGDSNGDVIDAEFPINSFCDLSRQKMYEVVKNKWCAPTAGADSPLVPKEALAKYRAERIKLFHLVLDHFKIKSGCR